MSSKNDSSTVRRNHIFYMTNIQITSGIISPREFFSSNLNKHVGTNKISARNLYKSLITIKLLIIVPRIVWKNELSESNKYWAEEEF